MNPAMKWLRATAQRVLHESTTPARLGVAVGVGVLFACTPFYGFQLALALGVAWLFKLNKVAVAAGTQFSFPPFAPFIVFASAWIGEWVVHRRSLSLSLAQLRAASVAEVVAQIGAAWLVGGVVVGVVCGTVVGSIVFVVAKRRAPTTSPTEAPPSPSGPAGG